MDDLLRNGPAIVTISVSILSIIIAVVWLLLPFFLLSRLRRIHESIEAWRREARQERGADNKSPFD